MGRSLGASVFSFLLISSIFINCVSSLEQVDYLQDDISSHTYLYDEYYEGVDNLDEVQLHLKLYDIIRNHTVISYGSAWEHLRNVDEDPMNEDNVTLFYMQRSQSENDTCGDGNDCTSQSWNREHVWPKSHGNFGTSMAKVAGTDLHALRPADNTVNSARGNKDFGNASAPHSECNECDSSSDFWEPSDSRKGDAARTIFYMDVRYNGFDSEPNLTLVNGTTESSSDNGFLGDLCILYGWHIIDPVNSIEFNRNNEVYLIQGNRNPFVDNENFVEKIWGNICEVGNDDSDGDGYDDQVDMFPNNSSEWFDSDLDGVGDNLDQFPLDASETLDSDLDGVGDNSDAFPLDASETLDSDFDGVGDNLDQFPLDASETLDSDLDGVGDNLDQFPNDASEIIDTDSDGVGDNSDAFPLDASETLDSDLDGVGDNLDQFPNDASEIIDTDSDGVGDNSDAFPLDASETLDSDFDGVGDNRDQYPLDSSRYQNIKSINSIFLLIPFFLAVLVYSILKNK